MTMTLSTVRYFSGWASSSSLSSFFFFLALPSALACFASPSVACSAAAASAFWAEKYHTAPPAPPAHSSATAAKAMMSFLFIYSLLPFGLHGEGGCDFVTFAQRTARAALRLFAFAAIAATAAVGQAAAVRCRDRHGDVVELPCRQVLAHIVADGVQLPQHLAIAGRQVHLQRAGAVPDRDFDAAQVGRIEPDHGVFAVALQLQLEAVAQGGAQRLLPAVRAAGQLDDVRRGGGIIGQRRGRGHDATERGSLLALFAAGIAVRGQASFLRHGRDGSCGGGEAGRHAFRTGHAVGVLRGHVAALDGSRCHDGALRPSSAILPAWLRTAAPSSAVTVPGVPVATAAAPAPAAAAAPAAGVPGRAAVSVRTTGRAVKLNSGIMAASGAWAPAASATTLASPSVAGACASAAGGVASPARPARSSIWANINGRPVLSAWPSTAPAEPVGVTPGLAPPFAATAPGSVVSAAGAPAGAVGIVIIMLRFRQIRYRGHRQASPLYALSYAASVCPVPYWPSAPAARRRRATGAGRPGLPVRPASTCPGRPRPARRTPSRYSTPPARPSRTPRSRRPGAGPAAGVVVAYPCFACTPSQPCLIVARRPTTSSTMAGSMSMPAR